MIAVTSHRPHGESAEYATNQIRAIDSWRPFFKHIFLFGPYEKDLCKGEVLTAKTEGDFPTIKSMVELAMWCDDYACLMNADIILGPEFNEVQKKIRDLSIPAATSYRYEFNGDMADAVRRKEDRGMDLFIARNDIWAMVHKEIPEDLRIGHNRWDSWLCGFFCHHLGFGFRQFTDARCVFHPNHGGRRQPHDGQIKYDSKYFTLAHVPSPL